MIGRDDIFQVKQEINNHVGSRVKIRANKGRKKIVVKEGVIQNTYPSIFVVKVYDTVHRSERVVSYSYTDVLTHTVELSLCKEILS
jgi:uncharacterized protein Veg